MDWSASALMTLPNMLSDWLIADPSFNLSPVAPVESARSLLRFNRKYSVIQATQYKCVSTLVLNSRLIRNVTMKKQQNDMLEHQNVSYM